MKMHAPLDPDCPEARRFVRALLNDPMTKAMGAPVDEIIEGFERRHRRRCKRCQEYGVANIEPQDEF
jgi:hypothetical protein